MTKHKPTVVFDFDGVIHSYISKWQGVCVIPDEPVPGIKETIDDIRASGYNVAVVSTRSAYEQGIAAIKAWLEKYDIEVDAICSEKPPAIVYIDDRAICFDGNTDALLEQIKNFKPWNRR